MKLIFSCLKTEFKRLFTLCIVKFLERGTASFIKPVFCKACQRILWLMKCQLEHLKISGWYKLIKYRSIPMILLNWGADILIIK